jgi:NDP-sugar pyrophosphorylase family protein
MKAMILAAGLGTRLRPLTNDRPKALVEVGGRTMLEITLARLRDFGISEVIVNVHHFADLVVQYLKKKNNFNMRVELSIEDELLDTGGGLKKAAWFLNDSDQNSGDDSFVLHNVDVLSSIDLEKMTGFHRENQALVTLAVQDRETSRYLLFDGRQVLCGRQAGRDQAPELVKKTTPVHAAAFSGIHIISARLFALMTEQGAFSIIDAYLRLAGRSEKIMAFGADQYYWRDLGRPENVAQAEKDIANKLVSA